MTSKGSLKACFALVGLLIGAISQAGTISVSTPTQGDFLGLTNTVNFNITGSVREVTVQVRAINQTDTSQVITVERRFTPNNDGEVSSSVPLNFNASTPGGLYNIVVTATEQGNTYNTVAPISVTVDVLAPKFVDFNPLSGSFVGGSVAVRARLDELNLEEWRVRFNNGDIPNNSGSTPDLLVNWDTSGVLADGPQTIEISATDRAKNSASRSITVTLDRRPPTITPLAPTNNTILRPSSSLAVVIEIRDQFQGSMDETGIDVLVLTPDNRFITRVSQRSLRVDGTRVVWTGRVRSKTPLPGRFKLVIRAVDKAGNQGQEQTVNLTQQGR